MRKAYAILSLLITGSIREKASNKKNRLKEENMLCAAMGDIHGHLPALEAVLKDLDELGIQTLVNTGDCLVGGTWPNEVIQLLRERAIPSVQGQGDRNVMRFMRKQKTLVKKLSDGERAAMQWTFENTHGENLEFLRSLPRQLKLTVDSVRIYLCHASPSGPSVTLTEDDPTEKFQRQREIEPVDIIVCGHTHRPFFRWVDGTLFVNPGAVGAHPGEVAKAAYALINTEETPWSVELRTARI